MRKSLCIRIKFFSKFQQLMSKKGPKLKAITESYPLSVLICLIFPAGFRVGKKFRNQALVVLTHVDSPRLC